MLKAGDRAPDFTLQNEHGDDTSLSGLLAEGPLILYFYPADFTPGCTKEACAIRDLHGDILSVGLQVVGVSPQDEDSHARFREKYELPFVLVSDPDKTVIRLYGVDGPFGVGVRRATYLIDRDRRVIDAVKADILISRHQEFINKAIQMRMAEGAGRPGGT